MPNIAVFPFRVFHRVEAPGVKPDEMYIPQYYENGYFRAYEKFGRKVTFATELEGQQFLITFVKDAIAKNKRQLERLAKETTDLEHNLAALNSALIGINARAPE